MDPSDVQLLADPALQDILRAHADDRPERFAFAIGKNRELPGRLLTEQLHCRQRFVRKVPDWAGRDLVLHPKGVEQCSSQAVARWHAATFSGPGQRVLDLCCGLGVDACHFAAAGATVTACERDPALAACLRHNAAQLGSAVDAVEDDGLRVLATLPDAALDLLYADPDRRPAQRRVLGLDECEPHLGELLGHARRVARRSLIKLAPASDPIEIENRIIDLGRLWGVSVEGEMKELLAQSEHRDTPGARDRCAVLLDAAGTERHRLCSVPDCPPPAIAAGADAWLFEPDPAVIRLGLIDEAAAPGSLALLHPAVAFLTGPHDVADFPGRRLRVLRCAPFDRKRWRSQLRCEGIRHANATCRHFPLSTPELLERLGLRAGGRHEIWAWRDADEQAWCALGQRP